MPSKSAWVLVLDFSSVGNNIQVFCKLNVTWSSNTADESFDMLVPASDNIIQRMQKIAAEAKVRADAISGEVIPLGSVFVQAFN